MTQTDLYMLGFFLLITAIFAVTRSRRPLFVLLSLVSVFLFLFTTSKLPGWRSPAEVFLSIAGLLLYSFGLLIVRVMFVRSVSLKLLFRLSGNTRLESTQESIATRFDDFKRYRLIRDETEPFQLSGFGQKIAALVSICYSLLRIK